MRWGSVVILGTCRCDVRVSVSSAMGTDGSCYFSVALKIATIPFHS